MLDEKIAKLKIAINNKTNIENKNEADSVLRANNVKQNRNQYVHFETSDSIHSSTKRKLLELKKENNISDITVATYDSETICGTTLGQIIKVNDEVEVNQAHRSFITGVEYLVVTSSIDCKMNFWDIKEPGFPQYTGINNKQRESLCLEFFKEMEGLGIVD
ncbi:hypothetical protein TpMuguga_04g00842 [Theileria parva strain Muguga]|uniref:Uncharacterized protein n=1 Tax=Theileria parva TaxID=5875 RepID=Q4N1A4_THEPA|nr:uncharacterized protein TpMuguga_04g00842 [Theileria parva strain Muguga]EAN32196.1 hypothetical protein TpMuguga_04g00842 [Theileria parva strain Muguga]|eukprot:XP_764479.1 hypothetical protein [Theileria parva strain Muguga]